MVKHTSGKQFAVYGGEQNAQIRSGNVTVIGSHPINDYRHDRSKTAIDLEAVAVISSSSRNIFDPSCARVN